VSVLGARLIESATWQPSAGTSVRVAKGVVMKSTHERAPITTHTKRKRKLAIVPGVRLIAMR